MVNLGDQLTQIDWEVAEKPVPYEQALARMEQRVNAILKGEDEELIWLLEHPPLLTAGTSARPEDLLESELFPVYETGRGGEYTYHGPGQRVVYVMLDLKRRRTDVRWFVHELEQWIIDTLENFGIKGERRDGRVGIWVEHSDNSSRREEKIAAIGIRVRRWVSFHGMAINLNPDLSHFNAIVPCGIKDYGVTSMNALGVKANFQDLDQALLDYFPFKDKS